MRAKPAKLGKTSVGFLLSLFLLSGSATIGCGENDAKIQARLTRAHKLFAERKTEQALREYKTLLKSNPDLLGARLMVGKLTYYKRDFRAAEKEFTLAVETDAGNTNARFWLAKSQSLIPGKEAEAMRNVTRVLEIDDGRIEAWYLKGLLQERRKDLKGALASYRYAAGQGKKLALVHMQLGLLYRKARLKEAAEREFRLAETLSRGEPAMLKQIKIAREVGIRR